MIGTQRALMLSVVAVVFHWSATPPRSTSSAPRLRETSCDALTAETSTSAEVVSATVVPSGAFNFPSPLTQRSWAGVQDVPPERLPAFCRIVVRLKPTATSDIGAEVWVPESGWNERVVMVGNGGIGGQVNYPMLAAMVSRGYAVASSDAGHHAANQREAFLGHPERVTDHAVRAVHLTTVAAKLLVARRHGRSPRFSYFNGSSTGGRQGIKAALAFPDDFDGIVAGAPYNDAVRVSIAQSWKVPAILARGVANSIAPASLALLHRAALDQCDAHDGVRDSVIERPDRCHVDLGTLLCHAPERNDRCLTPGEVEMARALYAPLRNPRTGETITEGFVPGSELTWRTTADEHPGRYQAILFRQQLDWPEPFDFDRDVDRLLALDAGRMDASSPALDVFFRRGGRLLMVHGWSDATVPALTSVRYYERVVAQVRDAKLLHSAFRLFMVPGMGHSRGGEGVNAFDSMRSIEDWVERRQVPERIVAARIIDGATVRTRPLCAWPRRAQWDGRGDTDHAASFACIE